MTRNRRRAKAATHADLTDLVGPFKVCVLDWKFPRAQVVRRKPVSRLNHACRRSHNLIAHYLRGCSIRVTLPFSISKSTDTTPSMSAIADRTVGSANRHKGPEHWLTNSDVWPASDVSEARRHRRRRDG
jgi:hypothetical protein